MDVIFGGIIFVLALVGFIVWIRSMKGIFQMLFKKKTEDKVMEAVDKVNESSRTEEVKTEPVDEWIRVEGYKATEKDMTCRGYQYELGIQHDMPEDAGIKECEQGFHLCKELNDVFGYYSVGDGNRYFKVKALVCKDDYERYGQIITNDYCYSLIWGERRYDKLVAKSIIFERELTPDEILEYCVDTSEWTDADKRLALSSSIDDVLNQINTKKLTDLGFSQMFAKIIVDSGKYEYAKAVASQPDLSMDMKCWLIFK